MAIGKLVRAIPKPDRILELTWDDHVQGEVALAVLIDELPGLAPLRDAREFAGGRLSEDGWSIEWPSGIDFGAAQLRHWLVAGVDARAAA